jgi:hypothetical protein
MRRFLHLGLAGLSAAVIAASPFLGEVPGMAAALRPGAAAGQPAWHLAYQSASKHSTQIYSVAAPSAGEAWAVGARSEAGSTEDQPFILRWDGTRWHTQSIPGLAGYYLPEVVAPSGHGVWIFAVSSQDGSAKAVRWNGNQWINVPLPAGVYPDDAVVLGPSDAWVLGRSYCPGPAASPGCTTTVYHWDGAGWTPFTVPVLADVLSGASLSGSAPGNVWLAGADGPCAAAPCSYRVDAYRWNGATWLHVAGMPRTRSYHLPGVAVGGARNAWVGTWAPATPRHPGRLLHWTGRRWQQVSAPRAVLAETPLVTDGHDGVWMGPWARWTGQRWVSMPALARGNSSACVLDDLTRVPGTTIVWGAGARQRTPGKPVFNAVICANPRVP